jgi:hypothetical protein
MIIRQDCAGAEAVDRLQSLARRVWSPERRFHIGDIAWGWFAIPGAETTYRTSVWQDRGVVLAWAWVEQPGHLELLVDPAALSLLPLVLDWFESVAPGPELSCVVMEGDYHERAELERRGYRPHADGPFFRRYVHDLTGLPMVSLPDGFAITHVTGDQAERRAEAHRAGWSEFGSRVTGDSYQRVMATDPYCESTDFVVVSPDGQWVASALGWYDEVNQVGLVEPVSCAPPCRRRGLAAAVNIALLHTFGSLGASTAVILPRGDQAYSAPASLYQSIGYQPGPRTVLYTQH